MGISEGLEGADDAANSRQKEARKVGRIGRAGTVDSGSADGAVSCGAAAPADLAFCVRGGAFPPNRNAVSLRSGSAWQVPRPVVSDWSAMGCDRCASRPMTERVGQFKTGRQSGSGKRYPQGLRGPVSHQKRTRRLRSKSRAAGACLASAMGKVLPLRIGCLC